MTSLLHERLPGTAERLPRIALGEGPTPVRRLDLPGDGPEVWLKDDSAFGGGGWGGNKVRKLEWTLADARRRRRGTVLSFGALATNHGLATALYARDHGLRCALALVDQPEDEHVRRQLERLRSSGAALHLTHTKARTVLALPWLLIRHSRGGRPPYLLPAGGSSPLGALGYVEAALELGAQVERGQLPEPRRVFVALGSGGTTAGLALGLRLAGLRSRAVGVVVNDKLRLDTRTIMRLARRTAGLLRARGAREVPEPAEPIIETGFLGPAYGVPTAQSSAALEAAEGAGLELELDPVYTAKAFAAVLAERQRDGEGPILFLNTHGPREAE